MSLRSCLRVKSNDLTELALEKRLHPGSEIIELQTERRFLVLELINEEDWSTTAYLDIDEWLKEMELYLPAIPWTQVPLSYLNRWLNTLQLRFNVEECIWSVQRLSAPAHPLPKELLQLPAQPCALLCQNWPVSDGLAVSSKQWVFQLPFTLDYVLGNSRIALSALTGLACGDVLVINQYSPRIVTGQCPLFHFNYHDGQEIIVEDKFAAEHDDFRQDEEILFEWMHLPVDVEFVLDSTTVLLKELDTIQPGTTLPVSHGAEKKIKIYINRKLLAYGELVSLENGALAVEINQILNSKSSSTGLEYAE